MFDSGSMFGQGGKTESA